MATFPDALQAALDALEHALPDLIATYPDPADFWPAFAGEADAIVDNAGPLSSEADERIQAMLDAHGLIALFITLPSSTEDGSEAC